LNVWCCQRQRVQKLRRGSPSCCCDARRGRRALPPSIVRHYACAALKHRLQLAERDRAPTLARSHRRQTIPFP
jgi:hypothetical protein